MKSTEIHHRDDFPLLCMMRNLVNCVEVGVDKGNYSALFLSRHWMLNKFWGVDSYEPYPEMPFGRGSDSYAAHKVYAKYGAKARLIQLTSAEAVKALSDLQKEYPHHYQPLQFIYIDGNHKTAAEDIRLWWPLLAPEGILAGHDYDPSHPEVMRDVDTFGRTSGRKVYTTWSDGDGPCHSWYLYKDLNTVPFRRVQCEA